MKILVTGSSGFIGSELSATLLQQRDFTVVGIDKTESVSHEKNIDFRKIDLSIEQPPQDMIKESSLVFHLAANPEVKIGAENSEIDFKDNIVATRNLLESLKTSGFQGTIVFASTSTVYGDASVIPTPETFGPLVPISMYGGSKLACEALVSSYAKLCGFNAKIIRFANVVGGTSKHGVIFDFVRKLRNNPTVLEILGDGTQSKSYVHITDCVDGLIESAKFGESVDIFNIGTEQRTNVKKIAEIVIKEMGLPEVEIKTSGGTRDGRGWPGDVKNMLLDCSKITSFGWKYRLTSDEAVREAAREMIKKS